MRKSIIATLLSATMVSVPVTALSDTYFDLMGDADKAISEGKWLEAEKSLKDAIALDPENPSNILLMSNLGLVQFYLGQDSAAIATLSDAHKRAPISVTVLKNRAEVYLALGRDSLAYNDYSKIIALDTTLIEPRYMHAVMSLRYGDYATAQNDCDALNRMSPGSDEANTAYGALYTATEQWEKAIPYYSELIKKKPSADLYSARAVCYLMTQKLNEASADIAAGLELDPDNGELYLYRGYLNKLRYRKDDARNDVRKAFELSEKE